MKQLKIISSEKEKKAFLHPLRSEILQILSQEQMTISQIAKLRNVHPANLTHHFKKLESAGLIFLAEERDIGRVVEKYYLATAKSFSIEQEVDGAGAKVLDFLRNDLEQNMKRLKQNDSDNLIGLIKLSRIKDSDFTIFSQKLNDLIEEFSSVDCDEGETYGLNVSLYPHRFDYGLLKSINIKKKGK